jgi:endonuclease/exonuclease/phosphatase (EEP) superfamily protein YafD
MVLGDLNLSPWSPYFGDLLSSAGLRDSREGFGIQASWPTAVPLLRVPIDHVLYSPEVVINHRQIGPDVGSDHLPVVVDFSLPAASSRLHYPLPTAGAERPRP